MPRPDQTQQRLVTWTVALSVYAHGLTAGPAATRYADWYHAHHEHHPVMPESVPVADQRPPQPPSCIEAGSALPWPLLA